jgi:hypothetical protein
VSWRVPHFSRAVASAEYLYLNPGFIMESVVSREALAQPQMVAQQLASADPVDYIKRFQVRVPARTEMLDVTLTLILTERSWLAHSGHCVGDRIHEFNWHAQR